MEISNEECREIARKLRDIKRVDLGDGLVCPSCDLGEALDFDWANDDYIFEATVNKLADLIYRPTCKPKDRGRGYVDAVCDSFCCSNCGFEIDVHIGEEQHLTETAKYCPSCGAEVSNEDN